MMKALQLQVESLTRQVSQLGPENERVRKLLTEFDQRHDADQDRISALEAALAKADELTGEVEGQATHRISGHPHSPAMPKVFSALAAYRQARDATR